MQKSVSVIFLLSALLTACGGGETGTPTPPPSGGVVRVELDTSSLLLENGKSGQKVVARAYNAQGQIVQAPLRFESSRPSVITVAADGEVNTLSVGSSQIVAIAGKVRSTPAIAASGVLSDQVVRIPDSKVVGAPQFPAGVTPFSVGGTYTVVLRDVSPTPGRLWFSRAPNGMTVQGKVVSSRSVTNGTEVTLEIVPLSEVFRDVAVNETLEVPARDVQFSPQMQAAYTITPGADGTFEFTPKSSVGATGVLSPLSFNVGPFKCDGSLPDAAFNLGTPTFTLNTGSPRWEFVWETPLPAIPFVTDGRAGKARVLFTASPSLTMRSGTHTITSNFNDQSVVCRYREEVRVPFEAFGFGFSANMKPGVTLGGSFGAGSRSFSAVGSVRSNVRMGFDCRAPGGCTNLSEGNAGTVRGALTLGGTGDLAATARDFQAGTFLDVGISVNTPISNFDLIRFTEGYRLTADFSPLAIQVSSGNPGDYSLGKYLDVDPFALVKDFVKFLIGTSPSGLPQIHLENMEAHSPTIQGLVINKSSTQITVSLQPDRINFFTVVSPFSLGYNVQKVRLLQRLVTGALTTLADVTPASGATTVTLTVPAGVDPGSLYVTLIPNVLEQLPVGTRKVTGVVLP